jgi:hypothetical protein
MGFIPVSIDAAALLAAITPPYRQPRCSNRDIALSTSKFMGLSSFAAWLQRQWVYTLRPILLQNRLK